MRIRGCCHGSTRTSLGPAEELAHFVGDGSELGYLLATMQEAACAVRMEAVVNVEVARGDLYGNKRLTLSGEMGLPDSPPR